MKRKTVWKDLKDRPTKVNKEGFPAYDRPIEEQVLSVLTTGTTANLFYTSAQDNIMQMIDVLKSCENMNYLAQATLYARKFGFMRTLPIAGLVEISVRSSTLFRKMARQICRNPKDWQQFIDICRSGVIRKGCGRAIKNLMNEVIKDMSPYHTVKYPAAIKDMINIARPDPDINRSTIKYIKEGNPCKEPTLCAVEDLKQAGSGDEAVKIIKGAKLPYEVVTGSVSKMTPAIWRQLFWNAPYFNLIRNLNNFIKNGVFEDSDALLEAHRMIADKDAVRKSKMFPFRFFVAHNMIREGIGSESIKVSLEKAMEHSLSNIPLLEGTTAIASDVSGSMSSNLTGENSILQCIDLVGIFSAAVYKRCEDPIILPFEHDIAEDFVKKFVKAEPLMKRANVFRARGGTSLSAPVEHLMSSEIKVDRFIAFTDNEQWVGSSFMEAWERYTGKIATDARAYLVTLLPYGDAPTPPHIKNVHYIYGWSDNVLKYITGKGIDEQVKDVKRIEI